MGSRLIRLDLGPGAPVEYKEEQAVFSRILRMQLMGPLQMRGLIMFLPQFVRVFWRLIHDARVSMLAKSVPLLGVLALISPPTAMRAPPAKSASSA